MYKVIKDYDFAFRIQKVNNHVGIGINYMHNAPVCTPYGIPNAFPRTRGIEVALLVYHFVLTWARHIES